MIRGARIFGFAFLVALAALAAVPAAARHHRASANADYDSYIEDYIERDSQHWLFNRFVRGSVHGSYVKAVSNDRRSLVVIANYRFNGNMDGWIGVMFTDNRLVCVEYWDNTGGCRDFIPPEWESWYNSGPGPSGNAPAPSQPYCGSECQQDIGRGRPQR